MDNRYSAYCNLTDLLDAAESLGETRHQLHMQPELSFHEVATAALVAARLEQWGFDVTRNAGGHGVVGTLKAGDGSRSVAVRADMDALPIHEETGKPYASAVPGAMHACGHDGHTTMLLGAARQLGRTRNFSGTLHLVFQQYTYSSNDFSATILTNLTTAANINSPAVNALFRFSNNGSTWTAFVDALEQDGLIKVLAEPNLVALSGQTATFLAGGEFPIPVPQSGGGSNTTITIEYQQFGVGLNFTPTVLSKDKISLKVAPEVSDLDFSNAIRVEGYFVPGLKVRRTSTTVELGDGQSFAIAGLLRENVRTRTCSGIPPFL